MPLPIAVCGDFRAKGDIPVCVVTLRQQVWGSCSRTRAGVSVGPARVRASCSTADR